MLKERLCRKYGLPLPPEPCGLDPIHQKILKALDANLSIEDLHAAIPCIPGLAGVTPPEFLLPALSEDELRRKYEFPPPGPLSVNAERIRTLSEADRGMRTYANDPHKKGTCEYLKSVIRGVIAEQRFICAWTADGHRQPGVKLVRGATPEEDQQKVDAVMELENNRTCRFQVKTGHEDSFLELADREIVLVRIKLDYTPPMIRNAAIEAMKDFAHYRANRAATEAA